MKGRLLSETAASAAAAIAKQQAVLDTVTRDQQAKVTAAQQALQDATQVLEGLRSQVNDRIGSLTGLGSNSRASVK